MPHNRNRARQLPAHALGVLNWQREFWLLIVEHALSGAKGPPDISHLKGFGAPALTQYTVTTPDLLRSFRKYNEGKPYHRQVRPFGFMVMFQQSDKPEPTTMMRVIAPFHRNPAKAARKAFDRDTGAPVRLKQLKTYAGSLRNYHNHPEAKFQNGERADRGPLQRRYIPARSISYIGKEANKLNSQILEGIDPEAQIEYHVDEARADRMKAAKIAVRRFGTSRVAREAGLSRKHVTAVVGGNVSATESTLCKIEQAIFHLEVASADRTLEIERARSHLRTEFELIRLRRLASNLGVSAGFLSRVISGERRLSLVLARRITKIWGFSH